VLETLNVNTDETAQKNKQKLILSMCLRIKFCNYHRPRRAKLLKSLYPELYKYQVMLHNITGCVDPPVILGSKEDGVKVAGEAPEDEGGAEGPDTEEDASRCS
jgi:hypothetical protein